MDTVSDALKFMRARSLSDAMRDREQRNKMMLDAARGGLMGVTTDVLGYPVDLMTTALRPFGYNVEKPVGGSDWLADKLTNPTGSVAETAGRVATGMLTPGPEDMLRMAGVLRPKAPVNELTTYHGSPHRINNVDEANPMGKFDLSKVGTGEGAQAYGHGIYLAESPGVAKSYADKLADRNNPRDVINSFILNRTEGGSVAGLREAMTQHELLSPIFSQDQSLLNDAMTLARGYDAGSNTYTDAAWAAALRLDTKLPTPKGHFYTVDLPDEHIAKMLDWDAPLSEQPEAVTEIVRDMLKQQGYLRPNDNGPRQLQSAYKAWKMERAGMAESGKGESIYGMLEKQLGSQESASQYLRERGIPGIKYFDGGSRAAGEGTRNFVIFDPDIAKILKRE